MVGQLHGAVLHLLCQVDAVQVLGENEGQQINRAQSITPHSHRGLMEAGIINGAQSNYYFACDPNPCDEQDSDNSKSLQLTTYGLQLSSSRKKRK